MGGEFGNAVIYISELASVERRGTLVTLLQCTVNLGMGLATLLVILLEETVSEGARRRPACAPGVPTRGRGQQRA